MLHIYFNQSDISQMVSGARMELGDKELSAEKGKARVEAPWASEERALEERGG